MTPYLAMKRTSRDTLRQHVTNLDRYLGSRYNDSRWLTEDNENFIPVNLLLAGLRENGKLSGEEHKRWANAHLTLVVPADYKAPDDFQCVGEMVRVESKRLVTQYTFDLQSNDIRINTEPNPSAGTEHRFKAWRLKSQPLTKVKLAVIQ